MSKAKLLVIDALIATLAIGAGFCFSFSARAYCKAEQRGITSDGKPKRGTDPTLDLNDTDARPSEMRGVIERYTADRGSLARFYSVEASSAMQSSQRS